ncbi:hypothetical protein [Sphingobacterium lumbrici]|uniref:hypothetical protein n=1 Tax=Sphingobacterium lumbrici TaxID=2559600 RepID=UPI00112C342A|nr:hypothetical protein [Sphingobacterium lumbrici]
MKVEKFIILIVGLFGNLFAFSQTDSSNMDNIYVGLLSQNVDKSVYTAMQNIWFANEKISYLAIPIPGKPQYLERVSPTLRDGEGRNGYIFEGNIYHQTPIMMGRNHGKHFWQTSRLTFDYGFNVRMTKDGSSPLVPNNNIFGLTVDKIIWNTESKFRIIYADSTLPFQNWEKLDKPLSTLSLNVTAHHFSNGQPDGFFYTESNDETTDRRNDYLKGDFSTNYIQTGLTYSHLFRSRNMFSAKLAYQHDATWFGPFKYSDEQRNAYGTDRIVGFLQFRKLFNVLKNRKVIDAIEKTPSGERPIKVRPYNNRELITRLEYEYIFGNMTNYPHENKYRMNNSLFIKYTQQNWRALGIVARIHYGRDYSNIRYDSPICMFLIGGSVDFNKFFIPLSSGRRFSLID